MNNSRTYECSTKCSSYVSTGKVFQILLRGRGYSLQWGGWEILLGKFVTNSSLTTEIEYLYTGIMNPVFQRFTIFSRTLISLRKNNLSHIFHCFILPWISPWFHDVSYMIHNLFFSTFPNQFNLLIFYFRLKTKLFSRFY